MIRIGLPLVLLLVSVAATQENPCLEALANGERARVAGDEEKAASFFRDARRAAARMPAGETRTSLERRIRTLLRKTDPRDSARTKAVMRAARNLVAVAKRYAAAEWYGTAEELLEIAASLDPDLASGTLEEVKAQGLRVHLARKETVIEAVDAALDWLARHQDPEKGCWDADGYHRQCRGERCTGDCLRIYDGAMTGLALLAFLGAGHSPHQGKYKDVVKSGTRFLQRIQDPEGCFGQRIEHFMYPHCVATLAMAEAYRMGKSPLLRIPVEKGVSFIVKAQNRDESGGGLLGWRYKVRSGRNDTSVTGWALRALLSARAADLPVPAEALRGGLTWIERMTDPETGRIGYEKVGVSPVRPDEEANEKWPRHRSESITAVGLLLSLSLGKDASDPLLAKGFELCRAQPPEWNEESGSIDMYYWYFGTLAFARRRANEWKAWDRAIRLAVIPHQAKEGCRRGSWDPAGPWGPHGGRIYATAFMCMTLEALVMK